MGDSLSHLDDLLNNMIITIIIIIMDKYQDLKGELKRIWSSSEVVVIHTV